MPQLSDTHLLYGADYNPEQWPESVWLDDMRLMQEAGVDLVTLAVFAWSRLQSAPGVFHFEWLDRIMDLLHEHGIRVDLATATASPPAWLVRLHPEILPTQADGTVLHSGSRQHYNPSSSAYRAACAELVEALATHYRGHPALAMWHINNEYACHVAADYGTETAAAFREWLKARHGSLDALNHAWGTAFWSQHFYAWDEVLPPLATPTISNPGQLLDFQRFSSDALLECLLLEKAILREITPDIPITTNFMADFKPLDYGRWAQELDFTSLNIYPEPSDGCLYNAMGGDLTRSLGEGKPWMIMEQVTTHVQWRERNATKEPGVMRLWSWQSVARGSDGICFFQWRQSRAGAEKFHGAMVGHGNPATQRCFQESKELGNELAGVPEIAGSRVAAQCGIYFDYENWWALEGPAQPNNDLTYSRPIDGIYQSLFEANLATDFVLERTDLEAYRLLIVPSLYLVKPGVAEKLHAWVEAGGIAVFSYFSGIVDELDHVHPGGYPGPGPLRDLLGLEVEEWAIPPSDAQTLSVDATEAGEDVGLSGNFSCRFWAEAVRPTTALPMARFADTWLAGRPALTRNTVGKGAAWYVAGQFQEDFYRQLIPIAAKEAGVRAPLTVPAGVEVVARDEGTSRYLFLLNHNAHSVEITSPGLCGEELLSRSRVDGYLSLPSKGVAVVAFDTTDTDPTFSAGR